MLSGQECKENNDAEKNNKNVMDAILWLGSEGVLTGDKYHQNYRLIVRDPMNADTIAALLIKLHKVGIKITDDDRVCHDRLHVYKENIVSIYKGVKALAPDEQKENYVLVMKSGQYAEYVGLLLDHMFSRNPFAKRSADKIRNIVWQCKELAKQIIELTWHRRPINTYEELKDVIKSLDPHLVLKPLSYKTELIAVSSSIDTTFFIKSVSKPKPALDAKEVQCISPSKSVI